MVLDVDIKHYCGTVDCMLHREMLGGGTRSCNTPSKMIFASPSLKLTIQVA